MPHICTIRRLPTALRRPSLFPSSLAESLSLIGSKSQECALRAPYAAICDWALENRRWGSKLTLANAPRFINESLGGSNMGLTYPPRTLA